MKHPASAPDLPAPSADAKQFSARLTEHIHEQVDAAGGHLGFDNFMELALYAPGLGYYTGGSSKFGAEGDFITAPEISSLFSRCLGQQCAQVLSSTRGDILEIGAGRGRMATDVLLQLQQLGTLPGRYYILELSPQLQDIQHQTLSKHAPELLSRVEWLTQWPEALHGVVLANEVLDALPVQRFRVTSQEVTELSVCWQDGFQWCETRADDRLRRALADVLPDLPEGYESEFCPALSGWIQGMSDCLQQGVVLLMDYGYSRAEYYHPERRQGTLACYYRHRRHEDPFLHVGLQDITAHVDFTAVAAAAVAADLDVRGYTTQAQFLLNLGILDMLGDSDPQDTVAHLELARQVKQLTLPGEMGETIRVMALARGDYPVLQGFSGKDLRGRL